MVVLLVVAPVVAELWFNGQGIDRYWLDPRLGRLALKDRVEPFIFVEKAKILTR
jgi:hypothetical protein